MYGNVEYIISNILKYRFVLFVFYPFVLNKEKKGEKESEGTKKRNIHIYLFFIPPFYERFTTNQRDKQYGEVGL